MAQLQNLTPHQAVKAHAREQHFYNWNIQRASNRKYFILQCKMCNEAVQYTNTNIGMWMKRGGQPKCKSDLCRCNNIKVSGDFTCVDTRTIQCNACQLPYIMLKDVYYFECYCQLKTKSMEHVIYKALDGANHRMSREAYWNRALTNHKCDMVVLGNGKRVYLEIDDKNHKGHPVRQRDDTNFNALFLENREDNEFLIRIDDRRILEPGFMPYFLDLVNNCEEPFKHLECSK